MFLQKIQKKETQKTKEKETQKTKKEKAKAKAKKGAKEEEAMVEVLTVHVNNIHCES